MLSEEEIKSLIVVRSGVCGDSCNSFHINHVEGQIRALCAVLMNGQLPPNTGNALSFFKAVGIPYDDNGDGTYGIPDDWLLAHGFVIDGDDYSHPTLGDW